MSQFRTTLRNRVDTVQQAIAEARRAGDSYTVSLHQARLDELLNLAARNNMDTTGWVAPAVAAPAVAAPAVATPAGDRD